MSGAVTFPGQERWLSSRACMSFPAHRDRWTWTCLLAEETLNQLFDAQRIGRFDAFSKNRGEIESIAAAKIRGGQHPPGDLYLEIADFEASPPFIEWAP